MSFLSFVYRHGIWISTPLFILFVVLLILCISGMVRTMRQARLLSVPLLDQQEVELREAGRVVLAMEGPFLSRRFAHLECELIGPDGMTVQSRPSLFRARSSSFTKAKMELRIYYVTTPGRHVFKIKFLGGEKPSDTEHRMVFTRPHLVRSVALVIGIVLSAALMIGSIVFFFLRLAGV
jgi:hypothetical protein